MRKLRRVDAPAFLTENCEAWGMAWKERHHANPGASFYWHEIEREPVNHKLLPLLKAQVQDHCSFCDHFPVDPPSNSTIEHFRPKSSFPLEAYRWENLYYCCDACQRKGEDFDDALIRPDEDDYCFDKYFRWDFTTGMLKVSEQASPADQHRAEVTLRLYGLNKGHPSLRLREQYLRSRAMDMALDNFGYRDFLDSPAAGPAT